MPGWAVAIAQPRAEAKAVLNATRLGFECFYPKIKVKCFHGRRRLLVEEPLFPRYFFVCIIDQWHALRNTIGVSGVIMNGERPALLGVDIFDRVRSQCDRDGFFIPESYFKFKVGGRVQIECGPFSGKFGIYKGMAPHDRAFVLIQWLGAMRRVEVSEGDLVTA